jgi:Homeodomain-like domain
VIVSSPEKILTAAGMRARGRTIPEVADTLGVSKRTVINWTHRPEYKTEHERVTRELNSGPTVEGTLLDALSARKDDGVDWTSRLKAAVELRNKPLPEIAAQAAEGPQTVVFYLPAGIPVPDHVVRGNPDDYAPGTDYEAE